MEKNKINAKTVKLSETYYTKFHHTPDIISRSQNLNPFDRFSFLEIVRSTKLFLSSRDKWFLGIGPSFNWITFHLHIFKTVTKDICSVSRFSSDFYRLHYLFRLSPPIKHAVFKIHTPQIQFLKFQNVLTETLSPSMGGRTL